jgi:RimJ/RimL family protein N-acetyltransferase
MRVVLETKRLKLVGKTREEARAAMEELQPRDRAQVSPVWLARLERSSSSDPWIHGFMISHRDGAMVGQCGFKGPPDAAGVVEIAYGMNADQQGKGYATEAAAALVDFVFASGQVKVVCAHTLPETNASGRVLTKCGFTKVGEVIDPEDGLVWRWEKRVASLPQ